MGPRGELICHILKDWKEAKLPAHLLDDLEVLHKLLQEISQAEQERDNAIALTECLNEQLQKSRAAFREATGHHYELHQKLLERLQERDNMVRELTNVIGRQSSRIQELENEIRSNKKG